MVFKMKRKGKAKGVSKAVKKYVQKEIKEDLVLKQAHYSFGPFQCSRASGSKVNLNLATLAGTLDRGSLETQREGDTILMHGCEIRASFAIGDTATPTASVPIAATVRCMLVYFPQNATANIAGNELLRDVGTDQGVRSPRYHEFMSKYKVLYDKTFELVAKYPAPAVSYIGFDRVNVICRKKWKRPLKVQYYSTASTATAADISNGLLTWVAFCDNAQVVFLNTQTSIDFSDA